ncbi:MAG: tetratricopeptide repeat protein [Bacteroidia bacterium]
MKKKAKKINIVPAQVSTFRVGVIYFATKQETQFPLLESLAVSSRNFQILVTGVEDQEHLKRLVTLGKVKLCTVDELAAAVSGTDADYWVAADSATSWNIPKSLHTLKVEDETRLYLPDSAKIDAGKPGLGKLMSRLYFNKLQAFFSPATENHSVWRAFVIHKEALLPILKAASFTRQIDLFHQISLMDLDHNGFELIAAAYPDYAKEAGKGASAGIKNYLRWFFPGALAVVKDKNAGYKERLHAFSRFLFASLFLLCLVGMPVLSFDYGISWDEKLQYEYAHDIYAYLTSFGEDKTIFDFETKSALWQPMQYYGSFFDVLTVAIVDVFGIENEFEMRHFLNAIFGVFGLLFAGLFARAVTNNWLTATLTFIFLLLTPSYFGHSMFNPKDIPFATGFYMAMYYMVHFIKELPNPRFSTLFLLILGIALSISIRVGGILIFPYILLFAGIKWLGVWTKEGMSEAFSQFRRYLFYFSIVLVFGYFLGLIFWPYALQDPLKNPLEALKGLSKVNYTTSYETFEGIRTYMSKVPWYYSLKLMALGSSLIVLLGAAIQILRIPFSPKNERAWNLMLIFMFLFPVLYAAYKESMLYNGWRHWFFVYVNLAVLAAWGWSWLIENQKKAVRYVGYAVVFLGIGNMTWWMVRSHPNQSVSVNELTGGLKGAYGYYETDYYSNSVRQAVEWFVENELPKLGDKHVTILTNNEPLSAQYYMKKYTDKVDIVWTREYELTKKQADYSIFTSRTMSKTTLLKGYYPPEGTIHVVELDGVPLCAVIKHENHYMAEGYLETDSSQYTEALEQFRKAVAYDPGNDEAWRMFGLAMANIGPQYADSALWALRKSIEVLPENFIAYDLSGMIFSSMNRHDTAITLFEKAISYKINYTNAHYNLGLSHYNQNNFLKAAASFENAIRYGGQQPMYYKLMGLCMLNLNRLTEAQQYLTFAAQNSNDPEAYHYLGQVFELQGNSAQAQQMYARAAELQGK